MSWEGSKETKRLEKLITKKGTNCSLKKTEAFLSFCLVVLASFLQVSFTKYSATIVCLITRLNVAFYGSFLLTFYFI